MNTCDIPCLLCAKPLRNFDPPSNHPMRGLEFRTNGHYGSRLFDWQEGELVVNICDDCLERSANEGKVLHYMPAPRVRHPKGEYSKWKPLGPK